MPSKIVENDGARILWNLTIQTDKQTDLVVLDKEQKRAAVIDAAISSYSNIRKNEHEKLRAVRRIVTDKLWTGQLRALVTPNKVVSRVRSNQC